MPQRQEGSKPSSKRPSRAAEGDHGLTGQGLHFMEGIHRCGTDQPGGLAAPSHRPALLGDGVPNTDEAMSAQPQNRKVNESESYRRTQSIEK